MMTIDTEIRHTTEVGGNVFADLGFAADEAQQLKQQADTVLAIKLNLMAAIEQWITENQFKQTTAADILQISHPRLSDIINKKTTKFTIDFLVAMLAKTDKRCSILVQ